MSLYNKVAVAVCDHQKSKLRGVAGADGFWVAELQVRQVKIGSKSCFDIFFKTVHTLIVNFQQLVMRVRNNDNNATPSHYYCW